MATTHARGHDYHLVDPSPWPIVGAIGAMLGFGGASERKMLTDMVRFPKYAAMFTERTWSNDRKRKWSAMVSPMGWKRTV